VGLGNGHRYMAGSTGGSRFLFRPIGKWGR